MDFIFIEEKEQCNELIKEIQNNYEILLDTETTSTDVYEAELLLLQLKIKENIYVLDVRKLGKDLIQYIFSLLKNKLIVGHNLKYDYKIIYLYCGIKLENLYDTMLTEILINQGVGKQFYSLAELAYQYCGIVLSKSERETFENYKEDYFTYDQIVYSALDVKYLDEIKSKQLGKNSIQNQEKVLELENGTIQPVCEMELSGVLLDQEWWKNLEIKAHETQKELENKIKDLILNNLNLSKYKTCLELAEDIKIPVKTKKLRNELESITDTTSITSFIKDNINIDSPLQMVRILNVLGVKVDNTNEKTLGEFKDTEIVSILINYREFNKKITTYGENFLKLIHPKTGRIHVDFNQLGTKTGRFSVSRLQQIPRDNNYRRAFIARPGYKLITADYDQAELRLIAEDSKETEMINAFLSGQDIHKKSATFIYDKPIDQITKDERYWGKTLNFAVVYGTSEYGLYYNFGIPIEKGRQYLKKYFEGYKNLAYYLETLGEAIWKSGYCPTMYGRRRYFEQKNLYKSLFEMRKYKASVLRELRNTRIQGTSADIVKLAMLRIGRENPFGDDLRLLMQIHDELVIEVKEEILKDSLDFVKNILLEEESRFLKLVPPAVSIEYNDYWLKG